MRLFGKCSAAVLSKGLAKVLITIYTRRRPEYVLLNVVIERFDLEEGDEVEIVIRKR